MTTCGSAPRFFFIIAVHLITMLCKIAHYTPEHPPNKFLYFCGMKYWLLMLDIIWALIISPVTVPLYTLGFIMRFVHKPYYRGYVRASKLVDEDHKAAESKAKSLEDAAAEIAKEEEE